MYLHINSGTSLLIRPQPLPFPSFKIYYSDTISSSILHNVLMQLKVPLSEVRGSKQHFFVKQHQLPQVITVIITPRIFLVFHWTSQLLKCVMCFKELSTLLLFILQYSSTKLSPVSEKDLQQNIVCRIL